MTFGAGMFGALSPTTMRRPTDQQGGLAAMLGGLAQQQQPQQMGMAPAPQPAAGGRIPVSGGSSPDLSKLFAEADKMASQSGGEGGINGFTPTAEAAGNLADYRAWNQIYNAVNTPRAPGTGMLPLETALYRQRIDVPKGMSGREIQNQMDLMMMSGLSYSEALGKLGYTGDIQGTGAGQSAASEAAQKEAEAFLKSLGLGGSSSGGGSGGSNSMSTSSSSRQASSSSNVPLSATAVTGGPGATEPGRIPVSTGTAATPGSITSKPAGVSNADWKKYQSLSDKIANRSRSISDKNQKWYDNFVAKYGTSTPAPGGGGGGGGGGGTPLPGGSTGGPQDYAAGLGLLTRPYDNPFERRNLWNQFPGGP